MLTRRSLFAGAAMLGFPTFAAAKPKKRDRVLLVAGQSLAVAWESAAVRKAFTQERHKTGDDASWRVVTTAFNGSSAMADFRNPLSPTNWWVDPNRPKIAGPRMREALQTIRSSRRKPDAVLWIQGQGDGAQWEVNGSRGLTEDQFIAAYMRAVILISKRLRRACAEDWKSIPFYIQTIGARRDEAGSEVPFRGFDLIRTAQLNLVAYHGARLNIHLGAVQPLNLPLADVVHPTAQSYRRLARMNARAID